MGAVTKNTVTTPYREWAFRQMVGQAYRNRHNP